MGQYLHDAWDRAWASITYRLKIVPIPVFIVNWEEQTDEGEDFYLSQDPVTDILSITSVHPVREDVIELLLKKRNCEQDVINELLKEGKLEKITYEGKNYLMRKS